MNRIFREDLIQRQKLQKKIREDVKFVKSLSQRENKFGSAHQSSPLENNLHKQRETNTDEGPI